MGDKCMKELIVGLEENNSLTELYLGNVQKNLDYNHIGCQGIREIFPIVVKSRVISLSKGWG